jgi:BirA family biotin operon repressor/biotin-[acetyl-CoA-carboxylase] ligase
MLTSDAILAGLGTREVPGPVYAYATLGSTMDEARQLLARHPSERSLLVVANEQRTGRGRLGRSWEAPPGSALLFTLALRPHWLPPEHAVALVHLAAVALCEGVTTATGLRSGLKWPNDLLLPARNLQVEPEIGTPDAGLTRTNTAASTSAMSPQQTQEPRDGTLWAKAGGILLESNLVGERLDFVLVGCGLNISASPPPESVRYPATNLAQALGRAVDRLAVLRAILAHFDAWRRHLLTIGSHVRIETAQGTLNGLAEAVSIDGSLLLRSSDGVLHTISSGDVGLI